jgi:hypothetical protein
MEMEVKFIPQKDIRNDGLGDYFYDSNGKLILLIADTGNPLYNKILLTHELVEQLLTEAGGIPEEDITKFDASHMDSEEPGDEADAPYRDEHLLCMAIEKMIISFLRIPWKKYEEALDGR